MGLASQASAQTILTPKPGPAPQINGPKVYGCRPGNPFLYRIPTTGAAADPFAAEGLPASLKLDADTGIITGTAPPRGEYLVTLARRERARQGRADVQDRLRRHALADAADGLEPLVRPLQPRSPTS